MRISDWSSDVCSSDLFERAHRQRPRLELLQRPQLAAEAGHAVDPQIARVGILQVHLALGKEAGNRADLGQQGLLVGRSEEHTSELQSLMRISYAVFCLKKKKQGHQNRRAYNEMFRVQQSQSIS